MTSNLISWKTLSFPTTTRTAVARQPAGSLCPRTWRTAAWILPTGALPTNLIPENGRSFYAAVFIVYLSFVLGYIQSFPQQRSFILSCLRCLPVVPNGSLRTKRTCGRVLPRDRCKDPDDDWDCKILPQHITSSRSPSCECNIYHTITRPTLIFVTCTP